MVRNPRIAGSLKQVLPRIGHALGDKSLSVRQAMAELLNSVSHVKAITFYEVASLEKIHTAIALDSPSITRKLIKLLLPSYLPPSASEPAERMLRLVKECPPAALKFCSNATTVGASADDILNLAVSLAERLSDVTMFNGDDTEAEAEVESEAQMVQKSKARSASQRDDSEVLSDEMTWEHTAQAVAELLNSIKIASEDNETEIGQVAHILAEMLQRAPTLRGKASALKSIRAVLNGSSLLNGLARECARNLSANDEAPLEADTLNAAKEALFTACNGEVGHMYLRKLIDALKCNESPSRQVWKRQSRTRSEEQHDQNEVIDPPSREPTMRLLEVLFCCQDGRQLLYSSGLADDALFALEQWCIWCADGNATQSVTRDAMLAFGKAALHNCNTSAKDAEEALATLVEQMAKMIKRIHAESYMRANETDGDSEKALSTFDYAALVAALCSDATLLNVQQGRAATDALSHAHVELDVSGSSNTFDTSKHLLQEHAVRLCKLQQTTSCDKPESSTAVINDMLKKLSVSTH